MVRPRFANLPAHQQQQTILRVALDEFASRGYHDAPPNRVIDAAGISKASMYHDVLSIADMEFSVSGAA